MWRWLSADALRPWRHRSWIVPHDPDFAEKAGRILDLYERRWNGRALQAARISIGGDCGAATCSWGSPTAVPGWPQRRRPSYPRARHQRCWVHTISNICDAVRRRNHDWVKADAQKIYRAASLAEARRAFERFRSHWQAGYSAMVRGLERDLPELLTLFEFPQHLWRKLRTTNAIERCFVEVRPRTRPMVLFTNVESENRITYAIFNRLNEEWKNHTLDVTRPRPVLLRPPSILARAPVL